MKRWGVIFLAFLMIGMAACNKQANKSYSLDIEETYEINEELMVESVEEGVLLVSHAFPWDANSLMVEMENSNIVLIDTPYTYDATKALVEWVRDVVGDDRKLYAINTGFHFDNLGGNQYLEEQEIPIYGTYTTVELIHEKGQAARKQFLSWLEAAEDKIYYAVYKDLKYVEPTELIDLQEDEERLIEFGDEELVLYYPGESHSPDNIVVYIPSKQILFGGCMVKEQAATSLGNTADADLEKWLVAIKRVKEKFAKETVKYVVPGHGLVGTAQALDRTLELLGQ